MMIDNIDIFRKHLLFKTAADRYVVHILRRVKDCATLKNELGSNECQRLIKTYYIDSLAYFDKKIPAIKELCNSNKARAYIYPQVRNARHVLFNIAEIAIEALNHNGIMIKPDKIVKTAFCAEKRSPRKRWVLDLDNDNMHGWTIDGIIDVIKSCNVKNDLDQDLPYVVPTKNGMHIISAPFDSKSAAEKCPYIFTFDGKARIVNNERVHGWLHRDGMSLLYLNLPDEEEIAQEKHSD